MSKVKVINWLDNYRGFIGHLSDSDADHWKTVIKSNIEGVTTGEVDKAVAALCEDRLENPQMKVSAKSIIDRIINNRHVSRFGHSFKDARCTIELNREFVKIDVSTLKEKLSNCSDPERAWEIICSPLESDACRILHAFADAHGILYKRFIPPKDSLDRLNHRRVVRPV